jgi:multisubunit Na+/H+ antiporter MnhE subunit
MKITKWTILEYEYSLVEFVLSFIIAFVVGYYLLISVTTGVAFSTIFIVTLVWALIVGLIWTYTRAHGLFSAKEKMKASEGN